MNAILWSLGSGRAAEGRQSWILQGRVSVKWGEAEVPSLSYGCQWDGMTEPLPSVNFGDGKKNSFFLVKHQWNQTVLIPVVKEKSNYGLLNSDLIPTSKLRALNMFYFEFSQQFSDTVKVFMSHFWWDNQVSELKVSSWYNVVYNSRSLVPFPLSRVLVPIVNRH